jgi:hypothetical protein
LALALSVFGYYHIEIEIGSTQIALNFLTNPQKLKLPNFEEECSGKDTFCPNLMFYQNELHDIGRTLRNFLFFVLVCEFSQGSFLEGCLRKKWVVSIFDHSKSENG